MSNSNKGKESEKKFHDAMTKLSANPLVSFYRKPDARSTIQMTSNGPKGRMTKRPGDFFIFHNGTATLIELKEVQHDYLIATSRFTQVSKMVRFSMTKNKAGGIVYHTTSKLWSFLPIHYLSKNKENTSYNTDDFRKYGSLKELILMEVLLKQEDVLNGNDG